MNNDRSLEIRENVFTYFIPVGFGSGWGYLLLYETNLKPNSII